MTFFFFFFFFFLFLSLPLKRDHIALLPNVLNGVISLNYAACFVRKGGRLVWKGSRFGGEKGWTVVGEDTRED